MNHAFLRTALVAGSVSALTLGGCVTITNTLPSSAPVAAAPAPSMQHASNGAPCQCACGAAHAPAYGAYYGGYDPRYTPAPAYDPRAQGYPAYDPAVIDPRAPQYYPGYPTYGGSYGGPQVIYVPVPQRTGGERTDATPRVEAPSGSIGSTGREGTRATVPSGSGAIGGGTVGGGNGSGSLGTGTTATRRDPAVAIGSGVRTPEPTRATETRAPEATRIGDPTRSPEGTRATEARTPESTRTGDPTRSPQGTRVTEARIPESTRTGDPTRSPQGTRATETRANEATRVSDPVRTPEPTRVEQKDARTVVDNASTAIDILDVVGVTQRVPVKILPQNPSVTVGATETGNGAVRVKVQPQADTRADVRGAGDAQRADDKSSAAARREKHTRKGSDAAVRVADVSTSAAVTESKGTDAKSDDDAVGAVAVERAKTESAD